MAVIAAIDWVSWRVVVSALWSTLAASAPKPTSARPLTAESSLSSWPVRCASSATALSSRLNRPAADSMLCCTLFTLWCSLVSRSSCACSASKAWPTVSQTACSWGSACSTFSETVPRSAHSECSSATGATWARSTSMCSANDSAHGGGRWVVSSNCLARPSSWAAMPGISCSRTSFTSHSSPSIRCRTSSIAPAFDLWSANWSCTVRASSSRMRSAAAGWFPRSRMWFPG